MATHEPKVYRDEGGNRLNFAADAKCLLQANATDIWVSPNGSDSSDGSMLTPYLTVTAAMAAVTATRKNVFLMPGEYEEADTVDWPDVRGVHLLGLEGDWSTIVKTDGTGDEVISVAPTQSSTFEMWMENIYLDHDTSGQDGLKIDNASMTAKMLIYLRNCGADGGSTDKSIITSHAYANEAIRIYANGDRAQGWAGIIYLDVGNGGDRFYADGLEFGAAIQSSADATALTVRLRWCIVPHEGGATGGNAAQTITTLSCYSDTPALLDTADLTGSHSETIVD